MESGFDIDLTGGADNGADDLPPGVQPGTLGGTDETSPEPETPVDLDSDFEAALASDDDDADWQPEEADDEPFAAEPSPPEPEPEPEPEPPQEVEALETGAEQNGKPSQENPVPKPPPKAKAKAKPRGKRAPKPASAAPPKPGVSGTVARRYFIFEKTQIEVEGQITEAFVRVQFSDPDTSAPMEGITARNRDLALLKAGKLFGHGYEGRLVATPESMWEEKDVRNKPREEFRVEVG
jgi:hypothetical protein